MKFISRRKEYRLVIRGTEVVKDGYGRPQVQEGETVEFKGGVFYTEDQNLINYLLNHKLYGLKFTSEVGNDPVAIKKYSMVFDDGAEISGPKLVAGFPERNTPDVKGPEMIRGARSTLDKQPTGLPEAKPAQEVEAPKSNIPKFITGDQVEALIDKKLDSFLEKLGSLTIQPKIRNSSQSYHCPECGEEFKSGFAVGKHKKEKHS